MCNLYLMYYVERGKATFEECFDEYDQEVTSHLPADSDKPLPANPQLEIKAKHNHHKQSRVRPSGLDETAQYHHVKGKVLTAAQSSNVTLKMPGAKPDKDDSYLCSAFRVKDWLNEVPVYITNFKVETTARKVHHMIIQGCKSPVKQPGEIW